jgi:hypothetical protein
MAIAVECGECFHTFSVKDEHAGKRGKCPQCGASVLVPARGEAARAAPAPQIPVRRSGGPRRPSGKAQASGSSSGLKLVLNILVGGVAFVASAIGGYFAFGFVQGLLAGRENVQQQVGDAVAPGPETVAEPGAPTGADPVPAGSEPSAAAAPDAGGPTAKQIAAAPAYDAAGLLAAMEDGEVSAGTLVRVMGVIKEFHPRNRGSMPTYDVRVILEAYYEEPEFAEMGHLVCEFVDQEPLRGLQVNQEVEFAGRRSDEKRWGSLVAAQLVKAGPIVEGLPVFEPMKREQFEALLERSEQSAIQLRDRYDVQFGLDTGFGLTFTKAPTLSPEVLKLLDAIDPLTHVALLCDLTPELGAALAKHSELDSISCNLGEKNPDFSGAAACKFLRGFSLGGNAAAKAGSLAIFNELPMLRDLELNMSTSGRWITDARLDELQELPQLRRIVLTGESFSDAGLRFLSGSPLLKEVDLSGTRIGGGGLVALPENSGVVSLNVEGSAFNDVGAAAVTRLQSLHTLDLGSTDITDNAAVALKTLPHLASLDVASTKITSAFVAELAGMPRLRKLQISDTAIDDAALEALAANPPPRLKWLQIERTKVTADGLRKLAAIKTLKQIDIEGKIDGLDAAKAELKSALPGLDI